MWSFLLQALWQWMGTGPRNEGCLVKPTKQSAQPSPAPHGTWPGPVELGAHATHLNSPCHGNPRSFPPHTAPAQGPGAPANISFRSQEPNLPSGFFHAAASSRSPHFPCSLFPTLQTSPVTLPLACLSITLTFSFCMSETFHHRVSQIKPLKTSRLSSKI